MRTVVFRFTAFICCALFCAHYFSAYAQDSAPVIVTGKVVDEQGAPMAGVTIIEEGGVNSKRDFGFTPSLIYRMVNPAFYAFMNPGLA